MNSLTVLICTYNRSSLLSSVLDSLNSISRPDAELEILVIPNACTDDTVTTLNNYIKRIESDQLVPLRYSVENTPGKSYALNHAIPLIDSQLIAFVDDDHRIHIDYLTEIIASHRSHPDASMFCGRILPDWDGSEPAWVHDEGEFKIYPLPVPRYDQGNEGKLISLEGPLPGGGNIIVKTSVFDHIGNFSTELGPHGHDLGGGEDSDFVQRALMHGEVLMYNPAIVQYHYVDQERLALPYVIKKSYSRSRSVTTVRSSQDSSVPKYLWRKLFTYLWKAIISLYWPEKRFYMVRSAASLGEISAFINSKGRPKS